MPVLPACGGHDAEDVSRAVYVASLQPYCKYLPVPAEVGLRRQLAQDVLARSLVGMSLSYK